MMRSRPPSVKLLRLGEAILQHQDGPDEVVLSEQCSSPMRLLQVEDLRTSFFTRRGVVRAVDGVSLAIDRSQTLSIVGESGCGKSVTALSIIGLLPRPSGRIVGGSISFEGRELTELSDRALEDVRGRQIAMIFQDPMTSLNPTVTVGTQITETLRRHVDVSATDARVRALELLEEVHIPNAHARLGDYPHQFSGGMRQRVMIAIAISCRPKLLIADEPTTALDVSVQAQILDLLDELRREHEMAMILITHDMGVVAQVADEVAVMYAGQVVEQADALELFERPEHPYTEALLGALPQLDAELTRDGRLQTIPGRPPELVDPPPGCRFAPRCVYAGIDDCPSKELPLRPVRPGHLVRTLHAASERAVGRAPR
jgi:peptide/nickel transport system ATP-binding protein